MQPATRWTARCPGCSMPSDSCSFRWACSDSPSRPRRFPPYRGMRGRDGSTSFRDTLSRSLGLVFLLTIPSAVGLVVLSQPLVGVVYQRGQFTAHDTEQTALALSFYCLGLVGYASTKLLAPAFYALDDVRVPMPRVGAIHRVELRLEQALRRRPGIRALVAGPVDIGSGDAELPACSSGSCERRQAASREGGCSRGA